MEMKNLIGLLEKLARYCIIQTSSFYTNDLFLTGFKGGPIRVVRLLLGGELHWLDEWTDRPSRLLEVEQAITFESEMSMTF